MPGTVRDTVREFGGRTKHRIQSIATRVRVVEIEARVLTEADLPPWYIRGVA